MAKAKNDSPPADEPAAAPTPAVDTTVPFLVEALLGGTYPDMGSTLARWRNVGDRFLVKCHRDFSHRWMRRVTADEAAAIPETKSIPQTTAKTRKIAPFLPM